MATHSEHSEHAHHPAGSDKGAAYVGLVSGLVFLIVVVFSIVTWTNGKYAHEGGEKAAAETTR